MLVVRNSNKQIIPICLKNDNIPYAFIFFVNYVRESLFAIKNVIKSKERKVLTNESFAAYVSLIMTKI
jgi:hypothetical protein